MNNASRHLRRRVLANEKLLICAYERLIEHGDPASRELAREIAAHISGYQTTHGPKSMELLVASAGG